MSLDTNGDWLKKMSPATDGKEENWKEDEAHKCDGTERNVMS